jgi:protein AroM
VIIGFLTIGQSPRTDITSDLPESLRSLKIVEAGALDDLTTEQIESLKPDESETLYVSRLRNRTEVVIARERLLPLLDQKIKLLRQDGAESIVLLCSGKLNLESEGMIIFPSRILESAVQSLLNGRGRLGVLVPEETQVRDAIEAWSTFADEIEALCFSPYGDSMDSLQASARAFADRDLIVLDCIGYSSEHRTIVRTLSRKPVISARTIMFRFLEELFT